MYEKASIRNSGTLCFGFAQMRELYAEMISEQSDESSLG
jgi:hypothetical protein